MGVCCLALTLAFVKRSLGKNPESVCVAVASRHSTFEKGDRGRNHTKPKPHMGQQRNESTETTMMTSTTLERLQQQQHGPTVPTVPTNPTLPSIMQKEEPTNHNKKGSNNPATVSSSVSSSTQPSFTPTMVERPPPVKSVVLTQQTNPGRTENIHRAIHKIRLSALSHNFGEVESAANQQRCSVIVVVKADGYGHGAIASALYLADHVGADAFAVATLEEGIALRKAFLQTQQQSMGGHCLGPAAGTLPVVNLLLPKTLPSSTTNTTATTATTTTTTNLATSVASNHTSAIGANGKANYHPTTISRTSLFYNPSSTSTTPPSEDDEEDALTVETIIPKVPRKSLRPTQIRILVLGPPVGYPRCFDDYYHWNIECMVSGPEVARALMEWVLNTEERKRIAVERAAAEAKQLALNGGYPLAPRPDGPCMTSYQQTQLTQGTTLQPTAVKTIPSSTSSSSSLERCDCATMDLLTINGDGTSVGAGSDANSNNTTNTTVPPEESIIQQQQQQQQQPPIRIRPPSATLGNVSGHDLAKELRAILMNQQNHHHHHHHQQQQQHHAAQKQQQQQQQQQPIPSVRASETSTSILLPGEVPPTTSVAKNSNMTTAPSSTIPSTATPTLFSTGLTTTTTSTTNTSTATATTSTTSATTLPAPTRVFAGIEEAARQSRTRQWIQKAQVFEERDSEEQEQLVGVGDTYDAGDSQPLSKSIPTNTNRSAVVLNKLGTTPRKRLRYHAMVDSGMGRLGFRTDPVSRDEQGKRRDTVEIIKELVQMEVSPTMDCPIEFYGMCTHMAEASSTSDYTHAQITKFKSLLKRIRAAGISIPTVSTDNSAALLTTNLTHFDPKELLSQEYADTRGFVRTGGAIYGQRPSFPQLRAVSTLMASVRHVANIKQGESVGYDRAYIATTNVRIATLTIGFADGYPRELGNGLGKVNIRGHLFPVAGNVCMDMLMVELGPAGDTEGVGAQVVVGDTAILWGPGDDEEGEGLVRLQDLAATLKTTQSALTCGLNKTRVLRQYGG